MKAALIKTQDGWEIHIGSMIYDITEQMNGFVAAEVAVEANKMQRQYATDMRQLAGEVEAFRRICHLCAPYTQMTGEG